MPQRRQGIAGAGFVVNAVQGGRHGTHGAQAQVVVPGFCFALPALQMCQRFRVYQTHLKSIIFNALFCSTAGLMVFTQAGDF